MFWKVTLEEDGAARDAAPAAWDGRFVLHRHCDGEGPHLDLRLEQEGYLVGWRVDGAALEGASWAVEKAPHPVAWLDRDGDAVRADAGMYAWEARSADGGVLVLDGEQGGVRRLRVTREAGLPIAAVRAVCEALAASGADPADAAGLIADGVTARRRAVARLCGLGRELDGDAFDEGVWRKALRLLPVEEIHAQLRAYEVRFDQKYPPQPVSRPERLPGEEPEGRGGAAMEIVRGGA